MEKGIKRTHANFDVIKKMEKERKKRGLSEYELSKRAGLSQSIISTWKSRNIEPSLASIEAIVNGLDMSLSDFFKDDEAKEINSMSDDYEIYCNRWLQMNEQERLIILKLLSLITRT